MCLLVGDHWSWGCRCSSCVEEVLQSWWSSWSWADCEVVGDWVGGLGGFDVGVELLGVHDGDSLEDRDIERGCLKG